MLILTAKRLFPLVATFAGVAFANVPSSAVAFTDLKQTYSLMVENGVLNHAKKAAPSADAKITLAKTVLDRIQLGEITPEQAITSGELKLEGKREAFSDFVGMLDRFPFWFNIVTP